MRKMTGPIGSVMVYGLGVTTARMFVGATSAIYLLSSGLTLADLGILKAIQAAIVFLADIPLGYLADKWGRSNVIRLTAALDVAWLALTAFGRYKPLFFVAEVFNALAIALYSGAFNALLMNVYKRETGKDEYEQVLGRYNTWQFGLMAGAAFTGSVLAPPDSSFVWWLAALVILTQLVLFNRILPKEERTHASASSIGSAWQSIVNDFRSISTVVLSSVSVTLLTSAYILLACVYQVLIQFWQPLIGADQMATYPGIFYGGSFLAILAAQWLAARCSGRKISGRSLVLCALALVITFALFAIFGQKLPIFSIIALVCSSFFFIRLLTISLYAAFQRMQPESMWATAESVLSALSRVLLLLLLPVLGGVSQQEGVMILPAILLVISLCAGGALLQFSKRSRVAGRSA